MSTRRQLRTIHFLRGALKLDEEDFCAMLAAYGAPERAPPPTSRHLSTTEAAALISALEWIIAHRPALRHGSATSRRHQATIYRLWREVSHAKRPAGRHRSLDRFLQRRFGLHSSRVLWTGRVPKLVRALVGMKRHGRRVAAGRE
jgi:hypothetical protein